MMIATAQAQPETNRTAPIVMGRKDYLSTLLRLIGMDLYKVRRRLMSKMLLIVGTLVVVFVMILLGFAGWYTASKPVSDFVPLSCAIRPAAGCINHAATQADMQSLKLAQETRYANLLNMPGVWNLGGLLILQLLSVLGIILAGALVGGEYSLGTVRLMFTRGPARSQFLIAKIVVLAIYIVPTILFLMLVATLLGAALSPLTGIGANLSFFTAAWAGHFVLFLLLGMVYWFVYALMALFFGTVGRSTVAGIVGPLVWLSAEPVLTRIIALMTNGSTGSLADFVRSIPDYFLGNNLSSLLQGQTNAIGFGEPAAYSDGHSLLVVAVYLLVFMSLAFWATARRDVTH